MFMAMLVCIIAHGIIEAVSHTKAKKKAASLAVKSAVSEGNDTETHSVTQPAEAAAKSKFRTWQYWKPYVLIAVPSIFDMVATSVMTMGLVYIDVSVMQMLRGTMVVFATIMNILFLRRRVRLYQWIAIIGTVSACALVGASCILGSMGSTTAKPWNLQIFGCFLVVISQLIQSGQIVAEDFLLSDVDAARSKLLGWRASGVCSSRSSSFLPCSCGVFLALITELTRILLTPSTWLPTIRSSLCLS